MTHKIHVFLSVAIMALVSEQKLDAKRIIRAVEGELENSATEFKGTGQEVKLTPKAGSKTNPVDSLKIKSSDRQRADLVLTAPLRFWLLNERCRELEQVGITIPLSDWPGSFAHWVAKFKQEEIVPATA